MNEKQTQKFYGLEVPEGWNREALDRWKDEASGFRKTISRLERQLHSKIFRLSGIAGNEENSMEAMRQLDKMKISTGIILNLISAMEFNDDE